MTELSDYYFVEETEFIAGKKVPSILNDYTDNLPSVVDRFFTRYYFTRSIYHDKKNVNDTPHLNDLKEINGTNRDPIVDDISKNENVTDFDEEHLILFHTNRVCFVGLSERHIAVRKGIKNINYNIGNVDRSQNHVSGKGKKGGMILQPLSTLAIITCMDDTEYKIISCITGKLIEINHRLTTNPNLACVEGDGYIAIILPKPDKCDAIKRTLYTR